MHLEGMQVLKSNKKKYIYKLRQCKSDCNLQTGNFEISYNRQTRIIKQKTNL